MPRPTCVLFLPKYSHRLCEKAIDIVCKYFDTMSLDLYEDGFKPDVVISFLSDRILKGKILELPNINFHPAPPKYPGRGGASYALYNGDKQYGATAHRMVEKVDAGEIYYLMSFPIRNYDCKGLFERAEDECLELLKRFCEHYSEHKKMPEPLGGGRFVKPKWNGKAKTRKDFEAFLNLGNVEEYIEVDGYFDEYGELGKKIRACQHPDFPGPYITIAGYKFELSKKQ